MIIGDSELVGPIGLVKDGPRVYLTTSSSSGKLSIHEFVIKTKEVELNINILKTLDKWKVIQNKEVEDLKSQLNNDYIIYTGSHYLDIHDIAYTEPLTIFRDMDTDLNVETFRASKIFKKNGWNKLSWESRVRLVEKQKRKQRKYGEIEETELNEENVISFIFVTKNGQVICIDLKRHEDTNEINPLRGLRITNVEATEEDVVYLLEYDDINDDLKLIYFSDNNGFEGIYGIEELEKVGSNKSRIKNYLVRTPVSNKPRVVTARVIGVYSKGIQSTTFVNYPLHNDFHKNIPEMILIPVMLLK